MTTIDAKTVKALRDKVGVGMMDCKKALQEAGGDMEKAIKILREKGLAAAAKRAGRVAAQGVVDLYPLGGKVGVLVEVNCETVCRPNEEFRSFVRDVVQVAAANPRFVSRGGSRAAAGGREILRKQALNEGKPGKVVKDRRRRLRSSTRKIASWSSLIFATRRSPSRTFWPTWWPRSGRISSFDDLPASRWAKASKRPASRAAQGTLDNKCSLF